MSYLNQIPGVMPNLMPTGLTPAESTSSQTQDPQATQAIPAQMTAPTVPSWIVTANQDNAALLSEAQALYSGEQAYYYLSNDENAEAFKLILGLRGLQDFSYIYLDHNEKRFQALSNLYFTIAPSNNQINASNLFDGLRKYIQEYQGQLSGYLDNLKSALEDPDHYFNQERTSIINQLRSLVEKTAEYLQVDLGAADLGTFAGLRSALETLLARFEGANTWQSEELLSVSSAILAVEVGAEAEEIAQIKESLLGIYRDELVLAFHKFESPNSLISLERTSVNGLGEVYTFGEETSGSLPAFIEYLARNLGCSGMADLSQYLEEQGIKVIDRDFLLSHLTQSGGVQGASGLPNGVIQSLIDPGITHAPAMPGFEENEEAVSFFAHEIAYLSTGINGRQLVIGLGEQSEGRRYIYFDPADPRLKALEIFYQESNTGVLSADSIRPAIRQFILNQLSQMSIEEARALANSLGVNPIGLSPVNLIQQIRNKLDQAPIRDLAGVVSDILAVRVGASPHRIEEIFDLIISGAGENKVLVGYHDFNPQALMLLERQTIEFPNGQTVEGLMFYGEEILHLEQQNGAIVENGQMTPLLLHLFASLYPGKTTSEILAAISQSNGGMLNCYLYEQGTSDLPLSINLPLAAGDPAVMESAYRFFAGDFQYQYISETAGPSIVGILTDGQTICLDCASGLTPLKLLYQNAFSGAQQPNLRASNLNLAYRRYIESTTNELSALLIILGEMEAELAAAPDEDSRKEIEEDIEELLYSKITLLQKLAEKFGLAAPSPEDIAGYKAALMAIVEKLDSLPQGERAEVAETILAASTGYDVSDIHELLALIKENKLSLSSRQLERGEIYRLSEQTISNIEINGYALKAFIYSAQPLSELDPLLKVMGTSLFGTAGQTLDGFNQEVAVRANNGFINADFYRTFSGSEFDGQIQIYFEHLPPQTEQEILTGSGKVAFVIADGEEILVQCYYSDGLDEPTFFIANESDPRLVYIKEQLSRYMGGHPINDYKEFFNALYAFYSQNQAALAGGSGEISEEAGTFEQNLAFNVYMRDFISLDNIAVESQLLDRAYELASDLSVVERKALFLILYLISEGKLLEPGTNSDYINITQNGEGLEDLSEESLRFIIETIKIFHREGQISFNGQNIFWNEDAFISAFSTVDRFDRSPSTQQDQLFIYAIAMLANKLIAPQLSGGPEKVAQLQNLLGISIYGPYMNPSLPDTQNHIILQQLHSLQSSIEDQQDVQTMVQNLFGSTFVPQITIDANFLEVLAEKSYERSHLEGVAFSLVLENSLIVRAARALGSEADAYAIISRYAELQNLEPTAQNIVSLLNSDLKIAILQSAIASISSASMPEELNEVYLDVDLQTSEVSLSEAVPELPLSPWTAPVAAAPASDEGTYLATVGHGSGLTSTELGKLANLWLYVFQMHPSAVSNEWEQMAAYFGAGTIGDVPPGFDTQDRMDLIALLHQVPAFLTPSILRGICELYEARSYVFMSINDLGASAIKKIVENEWFGLGAAQIDVLRFLLEQKLNESAGAEGQLLHIISNERKEALTALLAHLKGLAGATEDEQRALQHAIGALELYLLPDNIVPIQPPPNPGLAADLALIRQLAIDIQNGYYNVNGQALLGVAGFNFPQGINDAAKYQAAIAALQHVADLVSQATFIEPPPPLPMESFGDVLAGFWDQIGQGYSMTLSPMAMDVSVFSTGVEAGTIRTLKSMMYLDCIININEADKTLRDKGLELISRRDELWEEIENLRIQLAQYRAGHNGEDDPALRAQLNAKIAAYQDLAREYETLINYLVGLLPSLENDGLRFGIYLIALKYIAEGYRTLAKAKEFEKEQFVERGVAALLAERYGADHVPTAQERAQAKQDFLALHQSELESNYEHQFEDLNENTVEYETKFSLLYQNLNSDIIDARFMQTFDALFGGWQQADGSCIDHGIFEMPFVSVLASLSGAHLRIEGAGGELVHSGAELHDFIMEQFNQNPMWDNLATGTDNTDQARAKRALAFIISLMPRENVSFNAVNAAMSFIGNYAQHHTPLGHLWVPITGLAEAAMELNGVDDYFMVSVGPGQDQNTYLQNIREIVNNAGDLPDPMACIEDFGGEECLGILSGKSRASYMLAQIMQGYSTPDSRYRYNISGIANLYFGGQIDLTAPVDQQSVGLDEVENAFKAYENFMRMVEGNENGRRDLYLALVTQGRIKTNFGFGAGDGFLVDPELAKQALQELVWFLRAHPDLRFKLFDGLNASSVLEEMNISEAEKQQIMLGIMVLSQFVVDYSTIASTLAPNTPLTATGELSGAMGYAPADTLRTFYVSGEGANQTIVIQTIDPLTGQPVSRITPTAPKLEQESGGGFWSSMGDGFARMATGASELIGGFDADQLDMAFSEALLKGAEFGITIPVHIFAGFTNQILKIKDLAELYILSETAEDPAVREAYRMMYNQMVDNFWSGLASMYGSFFAFEMLPYVMLLEVEELLDKEQWGLALGLSAVAVPFAIQIFQKNMRFVNEAFRFLTNRTIDPAAWNQYGLASFPVSIAQNLMRYLQMGYRAGGSWLAQRELVQRIMTKLEASPAKRAGRAYMSVMGALEEGTRIIGGRITSERGGASHPQGLTGLAERIIRNLAGHPMPEGAVAGFSMNRFAQMGGGAGARVARLFGRTAMTFNDFINIRWGGFSPVRRAAYRMQGQYPAGIGAHVGRTVSGTRLQTVFDRTARTAIEAVLVEAGFSGTELGLMTNELSQNFLTQTGRHPTALAEQLEMFQAQALQQVYAQAQQENRQPTKQEIKLAMRQARRQFVQGMKQQVATMALQFTAQMLQNPDPSATPPAPAVQAVDATLGQQLMTQLGLQARGIGLTINSNVQLTALDVERVRFVIDHNPGVKNLVIDAEGFEVRDAEGRLISRVVFGSSRAAELPPVQAGVDILNVNALSAQIPGYAIEMEPTIGLTQEHIEVIKSMIEKVPPPLRAGLEIVVTRDGVALRSNRFGMEPVRWTERGLSAPHTIAVQGTGNAGAPLSILTSISLLSGGGQPTQINVSPNGVDAATNLAAEFEGVTLTDETMRSEILEAAHAKGINRIVITEALMANGAVNSQKLLDFINERTGALPRTLVMVTPEHFYSIGGEWMEGIKVEVSNNSYTFIDAEGREVARYELRDGYLLEKVSVNSLHPAAQALANDIARQARSIEFKILKPFYEMLGQSSTRIRFNEFLNNHPEFTESVSSAGRTAMGGASLGTGAVGAWIAEEIMERAGVEMPALRFLVGFAGFDLMARIPNFILTGEFSGGLSMSSLPHLGVFHLTNIGYNGALTALGVSQDSILRRAYVSLPVGAVATHLLFATLGETGYLARAAERLVSGSGRAVGAAGSRALTYLGEAGIVLMLNSVIGDSVGWAYSQFSDSIASDLQYLKEKAALSPDAYSFASTVFGETYGAMLVDFVDRVFGDDHLAQLHAELQEAQQAELSHRATQAAEAADNVWEAFSEVYRAYQATHPILIQEAALKQQLIEQGLSDAEIAEKLAEYEQEYLRDEAELLRQVISSNPQLKQLIKDILTFRSTYNVGSDSTNRLAEYFDEFGNIRYETMPQFLNELLATNSEGVQKVLDQQQEMLACEMFIRMFQGEQGLDVYQTLGFFNAAGEPDFDNPYVHQGFEYFKAQMKDQIAERLAGLMMRSAAGQNLYTQEEINNYTSMIEMDEYLGLVAGNWEDGFEINPEGHTDLGNSWLMNIFSLAVGKISSYGSQMAAELPDIKQTIFSIIVNALGATPEQMIGSLEALNFTPEAIAEALSQMLSDGSLRQLALSRSDMGVSNIDDKIKVGMYRLLYLQYLEQAPNSTLLRILEAYLSVLEGIPARQMYDDSWVNKAAAQSYLDQFNTALSQIRNNEDIDENMLLINSLFFKASLLEVPHNS